MSDIITVSTRCKFLAYTGRYLHVRIKDKHELSSISLLQSRLTILSPLFLDNLVVATFMRHSTRSHLQQLLVSHQGTRLPERQYYKTALFITRLS